MAVHGIVVTLREGGGQRLSWSCLGLMTLFVLLTPSKKPR